MDIAQKVSSMILGLTKKSKHKSASAAGQNNGSGS